MITLTMKSARQPDFQMARDSLIDEIAKEYRRHSFVLKSPNLPKGEKKRFEAVLNREAGKNRICQISGIFVLLLVEGVREKSHYSFR